MTSQARIPLKAQWPGARAGVLAGAVLAGLVVPPFVFATAQASPSEVCGASDKNVPSEIVSLVAARDVWAEFPAMRQVPSLETDVPATMVVFNNGYDAGFVTTGGPGTQAAGDTGLVVCVVPKAGRPMVMSNVDPAGSRVAK